jgi:hypothetical protein
MLTVQVLLLELSQPAQLVKLEPVLGVPVITKLSP